MTEVKNLIFDLGGVILDLSVDHTLQSFADLSGIDKQKVVEIFHSSEGFLLYEKGMMSDAEFRDFIRHVYKVNVQDQEIDRCWNAMLRGFPLAKLKLLNDLKVRYQVFLLSNTNGIHLEYINSRMLPAISHGISLDVFFHKAYYSHLMKKRKPDAHIFQQVLKENQLVAAETLFLDDNESNILGAQAVGIQTVHIVTQNQMLEYFNA
jgi:glucose-1-phosphatase